MRARQSEIGTTRQELRQVDVSIQDLNRRIEHLERIAEKWQVHSPAQRDAGSRLNHQA